MLPPLKVRIGADTSGLERGLASARRNLSRFAAAAAVATAAVAGALAVMTRQGLVAIDAQAKLASSVGGSVRSLQNLSRAAELAGVAQNQLEASLFRMTRRISLAEQGMGPAVDAFERLGLAAKDLNQLDTDERLNTLVRRIREVIPAAQQAGVASQVFGEEAGLLIMRLDSDVIATATQDVHDFGLAVSELGARQIQQANDALSRLSLTFTGLRNQLAVEMAPVLTRVADQLAELARSDQVREAIERLVAALGDLADVLLSEDFLGVAIAGLEGLVNISASAAELMVTLSQNVELVTIAFSGLAVAAAVAGGPITLVVGALTAALIGIAKWRGAAEDASEGSRAAAEAQEALNEALGVFHDTAAPNAAAGAIDAANANYKFAESAMAAAEAELAKVKAMIASAKDLTMLDVLRGRARSDEILRSEKAEREALARVEAAESALAAARVARNLTAREVTGSTAMTLDPINVSGGGEGEDDEDGPKALPGLGSGADVQAQLEQRLERLQEGLMTERELVTEWYQEGMDTLREAREQELITEKEFQEQKERLEQEHQRRLQMIRESGADNAFSTVIGTGQEILRAMGSHNKKAMKLAQTLGQFEATVNAYRAASQALANASLPWWKKLSFAGTLLATGLGFASSIASLSESGGGGGGGSRSSASAGGGGAASRPTSLQASVTFRGDYFTSDQVKAGTVELMDSLVDEMQRRGIDLTVTA